MGSTICAELRYGHFFVFFTPSVFCQCLFSLFIFYLQFLEGAIKDERVIELRKKDTVRAENWWGKQKQPKRKRKEKKNCEQ